jgi:ATP-binding cassette subfamily B protein
MIINRFNSNINTIIRETTNLTKIRHFVEDLKDFKDLKHIEIKNNDYQGNVFYSIKFDNVYFCYPNTDRYILKGVSFEIKKGMQCSLIGLNGAGKTTITKLMMGFYRPTSGKILINNVDITEYSYDQLSSFFVCMQQELINYKMTVRENLGLFKINKRIDDNSLDQVLSRCKVLDLKEKFNNDYDTNLSPELENGIMLSGGEWQKIAIARSMFAERDFYILDEPTAALDPLSEVEFYHNFKSLMDNKTCLYITHRLGSTYLFDQCIVLNDGIIEEIGTHEELMNIKNGVYKRLYNEQKSWYVVRDGNYEAN